MENRQIENKLQKPSTLDKKLLLLKKLKQGKIQECATLLESLSQCSRTNPQLYSKFNDFVSAHKQQIIENEKQEQYQPQVEIEHSDQIGSFQNDSEDESSQNENEINGKSQNIFKEVSNHTKITEQNQKRNFFVETVAKKQNKLKIPTFNSKSPTANSKIQQKPFIKKNQQKISKAANKPNSRK